METPEEVRDFVAGAGLKLEIGDGSFLRRRLASGIRRTTRKALSWIGEERFVIVAEGDRLRLLKETEALEYWKKRLDGP